MSRRRWGAALVLAAALAWPGAATAQFAQFQLSDSALVVLTGDSAFADLRIGRSGGTSDWQITLLYDGGRVQVTSADTVPGWGSLFNPPSLVTGANSATLAGGGTGTSSFSSFVARVWFHMDSSATTGSLISLRLDSLLDQGGTDALAAQPHYQVPLRVCRGVRRYGDVDVDRRVTGRDALIVLTESVGIATSGFELQWADVDLDGLASSRDALFILSTAVGVSTFTQSGNNVADFCDPLAPAPSDLAYFNTSTGELEMIPAGDTIAVVVPRTTGFDTSQRPSFSPDGARIAYEFGSWLYAVNVDGSNPDTLNTTCCNEEPSWSPDGTQIAFVSFRSSRSAVWIMDADGQNEFKLTPDFSSVDDLQWAADGSRLFFAAYDSLSATNQLRVWSIAPDSSNLTQVETAEPGWSVDDLSVSPAVDSVVYENAGFAYVMALTDTLASPLSDLLVGLAHPWWDDAGIMFSSAPVSFRRIFYRRNSDGRVLRLTRNAAFNTSRLTARSGNPVYVSQVALDSASVTFASTTAPPKMVVATVTNSDLTVNSSVPVTWLSRDTGVATVAAGQISPVAVGSTFVVAHVRGWRSDSVQVTVN